VGPAAAIVAMLLAARRPAGSMDPGWPNVLIAFVFVVVVGAVVVSVVMFRRARASLSDGRRRRQ
jgi:heme/copper-type cytochrome/quinol oxidase subunit 2